VLFFTQIHFGIVSAKLSGLYHSSRP